MPRLSIDEAIRAQVLGVQGVAAIVGNRLWADDAAPQQPVKPYGLIQLIGPAERFKTLRGMKKTVRARYQVDFWADAKAEVRTLAGLVTARKDEGGLDGFQGTMGSGVTAAYVQSCFVENPRHGSEDSQSGGEAAVYNAGFDLVIVFNE